MCRQGIRSEIVEISAQAMLETPDNNQFNVVCHAEEEQHCLGSGANSRFKSAKEGLGLFLRWLCQYNQVVLIAFNIHKRKWPGLVNHTYFHGLDKDFLLQIKGTCDLKMLLADTCKSDSLEKVHKSVLLSEKCTLGSRDR